MTEILIVDDHAIVRKGLMQLFEEQLDFQAHFDEAPTGSEAIRKIAEHPYHMVLLDISLPGRSGLEVLKQLKKEKPDLPVLIISMYPEEQYAIRALKAGAAGYLTKESAPEELILAVKKVLQGGRYVSASLSELLASEVTRSGKGDGMPHEHLSDREYQVACMIASGKTPTEISSELSLSVKTVSTYRTRILEKMNMHTNAEITTYLIRHGLVN